VPALRSALDAATLCDATQTKYVLGERAAAERREMRTEPSLRPDPLGDRMKLFISWSGERSMFVAAALREWLQMMLQAVDPWMSKVDVKAGGKWNPELERELSQAVFGITCITRSNLRAPWLLFEAGALTTQVKTKAFLCPYLVDLEAGDLDFPLAQFQAKKWDRDGTLDLVRGINSAINDVEATAALPDAILEKLFDSLWPQLETKFRTAPEEEHSEIKARDPNEILMETLEQTREIARRLGRVEEVVDDVQRRGFAERYLQALQFPHISGSSMSVVPSGILGVLPYAQMSKGSPLQDLVDPKIKQKIDYEVAKSMEAIKKEVEELRCRKCGETENFRTEVKEFSATGSHHDIICEKCNVVVRQLHRIKGDEREWSCTRKCKFHLG